MNKVGIGIIGCGNISGAYLKAMKSFPILDIKGVADLNRELAEAKAAEFGLKAVDIAALFADPTIEIIVNLTIPKAHVAVGLQALDAGKHTYSEKPLGINFAEGKKLADAAAAKGLRIGAAPDTFLGGGHQTARAIIDEGAIGIPVGGTATFMCRATSAGIQIRLSITKSAAARCSTWVPTTSPISSICSVPSPRLPALR